LNVSRKSAAVYRRGDHYFVHANSMTDAGFWIASMPAMLLPVSSSVEALGAVVADTLAAGAVRVPTPSREEYRAVHAPLLKVAGLRSWSTLQRSAALCNIWQAANAVLVEPTRNGGTAGDDKGYHPLSDQSVAVPAEFSPSELGLAIVAAFQRCC
jgi:hypothetical protein